MGVVYYLILLDYYAHKWICWNIEVGFHEWTFLNQTDGKEKILTMNMLGNSVS